VKLYQIYDFIMNSFKLFQPARQGHSGGLAKKLLFSAHFFPFLPVRQADFLSVALLPARSIQAGATQKRLQLGKKHLIFASIQKV